MGSRGKLALAVSPIHFAPKSVKEAPRQGRTQLVHSGFGATSSKTSTYEYDMMRKATMAGFSALIALFVPAIADAKSYQGDGGGKTKHRSVAHRNQESNDGGGATSRSCLTGDARALLNSIENHFGRVEIVSTCRPGARIATSGRPSKHASGEAIDFRVPGKKKQVVQWLINNHGDGGTMTYSDMDHIHVDVGHHFVALNRPSGH